MKDKNKSIGCLDAVKWMYSYVKEYKKWLFSGAAAAVILIIVNELKQQKNRLLHQLRQQMHMILS